MQKKKKIHVSAHIYRPYVKHVFVLIDTNMLLGSGTSFFLKICKKCYALNSSLG